MKKLAIAFLAILLFISFACQDNKKAASSNISELKPDEQKPGVSEPDEVNKSVSDFQQVQIPPPQGDQTKNVQRQTPTKSPDWDKKIIKTASLNLEIKDFKKYNAGFRDNVKRVGGYIA